MLRRIGGQVRAGFGGVYGLDFGAVLLLASAMGACSSLLVSTLPEVEAIIVRAASKDPDE